MKNQRNLKAVRIRAVGSTLSEGLLHYVVEESDAVMILDNFAPNAMFRVHAALSKMPDGTLENSAGQKFEIVPGGLMYVAWQRSDGLVGVSPEPWEPYGFGDCSFRKIGARATYNEAVDLALAAPGAKRPSSDPLTRQPENS